MVTAAAVVVPCDNGIVVMVAIRDSGGDRGGGIGSSGHDDTHTVYA